MSCVYCIYYIAYRFGIDICGWTVLSYNFKYVLQIRATWSCIENFAHYSVITKRTKLTVPLASPNVTPHSTHLPFHQISKDILVSTLRGPFQSILDISGLSTLRMSSASLRNKVSKFSCKCWSISKQFLCIECHPGISLCAANLWRVDLIQSICFFFLSFIFFF